MEGLTGCVPISAYLEWSAGTLCEESARPRAGWSLLILRECFLRKRRFEAFQSSLGITRHLLAERLKKLVRFGVLRRIPYQESPKRYEYILTQKGLDLYPIIMSIVHWGNIHMVDARGRPLLHEHKSCGKMFDPLMVCSESGDPLTAKGVHVPPGPGARRPPRGVPPA